jgi:DNA-binding GntR family transcriptional regulator
MNLLEQNALGDDERSRISRPSLHDVVVSRVRDMIIEGTLPPGSRIHEGQLGEKLGISRTPLREALKFLASEGLVDLVPSRGAVVRKFSPKDVQDMLIVLGNMETLAGQLACAKASDAEIAEVRRLHDEMMQCYEARNRLQYFKLNQDIHRAIVRISSNEALGYVHGLLQSRVKRIRFIGHEGPEKWASAVADHVQMIEALEARDGDRLGRILGQHIAVTWERVKDSL